MSHIHIKKKNETEEEKKKERVSIRREGRCEGGLGEENHRF